MADVKVRIIAQDEASPPLDKIGKEALKTKQAFAKLESGLMTVAAGFGLTNIIGSAVEKLRSAIVSSYELASGLEQATIAFTTMLGSGEKANKMLADLKAFADQTPFEFLELQDAAKRMMAYGFAAEDVIPILKSVGDAAAALGGGGAMIQRITTALGQMSAKGKVGNDDLRQLAETGIPALKHLADAAGVSTAAMSKMIERGIIPADQAVKVLTASMTRDFGGLMAKQAETAGGKVSTMKDALAGLSTEIGKSALPAVKRLAEGVAIAAKATEGFIAAQNREYATLEQLQDMVRKGGISFEEYATVVNATGAAVENAFGSMAILGSVFKDQEGVVRLLKEGQKKLDDQYAISRERLEDYKGAVEAVVPELTPMQKAINEATENLERHADALSLVKGSYDNFKKTRGDLKATEAEQRKGIAKLTEDYNKQRAAILAGNGAIVDNSTEIERVLIAQGRLGISVSNLNEQFANQDGIDRYNDGMQDIDESIQALQKRQQDGSMSADDYASAMDKLTDRQAAVRKQFEDGKLPADEYSLSTRDNALDAQELDKKLAELTRTHGTGKTAAEQAAGAQAIYNTKLKDAQAALQLTLDKEKELRNFVAEGIKRTIIEKQIASLAEDGLTQEEIQRIRDTAAAFGLAKDANVNAILIEQGAATAFAKLEESNALGFLKDQTKKSIAHAAFVESVGKDIQMGLVPNYQRALDAAMAANGELDHTASVWNGLQDKTINLTIITRRQEILGEGKDAGDSVPMSAAQVAASNASVGTSRPSSMTAAQQQAANAQMATSHGPDRAAGGVFGARANPFFVGERGMELIDPSGGGRVYSATQTANMGAGAGSQSLRIGTVNLYGVQDTSSLFEALRKEARARGLAIAT